MEKKRVVPKKNYLYLFIMFICVIVVTLLIFSINKKYQNKKLDESYMNGYINEISLSEANNVMIEANSDMFILITKTDDENVYNYEVNLKKIIKKKDLRDNFIYLKNSNIDEINKKFNVEIKSVPAIIYYKNGEFVKSIEGLQATDFEQMLEEYEVK